MNVVSNRPALNLDGATRANLSRPGNVPGNVDVQPGTPFFAQLLSIAQRRKWILIVAIVGTLLAGIVLTMLMTPKFTASNMIEIQREGTTFSAVEGAQPKASSTDAEFYETQYGLLKAISLSERVARDLRLYDSAHFFTVSGGPKAWVVDGRISPDAPSREDRIRVAGSMLLANMKVGSQRQSRLVQLSYTNPDPLLAKQVVDAWARAFIQATLDRRYEASSYARRFLEGRLKQLRERIDSSERQLVAYARQQKIVNIPATQSASGGGSGGDRPLIAENLSALNTELATATADRIRAQSRLAVSSNTATEAVQSSAVNGLRQQRTELAASYAKLMAQFEPDYPPAKAIQNQISSIDRSLAREEGRVASSVQSNYQAALERERDLTARVEGLKAGVLDFRQRSIQYNIYQRDADTNRQLYDALLQRYKEIGVAGGVGVNNISIVDDAQMPGAPSSPNWMLNLAVALLLGSVIGVGITVLLEQLDQGISDPKVVEDALGVPLLGTIPLIDSDNIVAALGDPKSPLYESYLSLRTTLGFTTEHGVPRTISVTSTRPGEGKSTTSFALACSIARGGVRTLLLDGDMRSPSVHHELGIRNKLGLSNFLSGNDDLDSMIHGTSFAGMSVMTAGPQPPSAAELLSNERMSHLLERLLQTYDHVIIDAPPIMGLADAPIIGSLVEGVVFVIESHATEKGTVLVAIERMRAASVNVVGAVLTKFNVKRAHYGYGYSYGYGYGYGSDAND